MLIRLVLPGKTLEKTERQHGDDYVVLAAHVLLEKYREEKDIAFILHAIVLLESALSKSIYNFQFKMALIRLYLIIGKSGCGGVGCWQITVPLLSVLTPCPVGAYDPAHRIFATLDIKHIQFDTLT